MCSGGVLQNEHAGAFSHVQIIIKLHLKNNLCASHQATTAAEAADMLQTFPNYGSLQARDF